MKIIHCADLHLDSPMETHMTGRQSAMRNDELLKAFVNLTAYADKNAVQLVLIAGDLKDNSRLIIDPEKYKNDISLKGEV